MTIARSISDDHPFFDECLQLYLLNVTTLAVSLHVETQNDVRRFADALELLHSAFSGKEQEKITKLFNDIGGVWEVPDYPPAVRWQSTGCNEDCLMHISQELVDFSRRGENKPAKLAFALEPTNQTAISGEIVFPEPDEGFAAMDGVVPTTLFETVLTYLIGGSFERFKDHFQVKFGGTVARWAPELQFFRHLRNGCFHSNTFRIDQYRGADQIDASNPPRWHTYVMPSDGAMNGRKVVGEGAFFHITHLLALLDDMGKLI